MSIPPVPTITWERVRSEAYFYGLLTLGLFAVFVFAGLMLEVAGRRYDAIDHDHLLIGYLINNHVTAPLTVAIILAAATGMLRFTVQSITRPVREVRDAFTELREEFKGSVQDRQNLWHTQQNVAVVANNAADTSNRAIETCNLVLERLERHERSSAAHAPRRPRTA